MAMLFAATYPERTNALVLIDSFARTLRADDYPFGTTPDVLDTIIRAMEEVWGTGVFASSPCGPR
jgi:pimeloyl-ACP methyl ester carboxylesterase